MPPRAKFLKEEIILAAVDIVEREGIESLTARSLATALNSSTCPIFTVFENMYEVFDSVFDRANEIYGGYVEQGLNEDNAFMGVGKAYIRFAKEHPKLFALLFMRERVENASMESILCGIEDHYAHVMLSIEIGYGMDIKTAERLYLNMWIYTHGIAVLVATNMCTFSDEQISDMLTDVGGAMIRKIKAGG